jgi:hypothetical protein
MCFKKTASQAVKLFLKIERVADMLRSILAIAPKGLAVAHDDTLIQ